MPDLPNLLNNDQLNTNVYILVNSLQKPRGKTISYKMTELAPRFHQKVGSRNYQNLKAKLNIIDKENHVAALPIIEI